MVNLNVASQDNFMGMDSYTVEHTFCMHISVNTLHLEYTPSPGNPAIKFKEEEGGGGLPGLVEEIGSANQCLDGSCPLIMLTPLPLQWKIASILGQVSCFVVYTRGKWYGRPMVCSVRFS